jgi:hypothetical protein
MALLAQIHILVNKGHKTEAHVTEAAKRAMVAVETVMRQYGLEPLGAETCVGKATKEEHIRLTPRKIHFGISTFKCCSRIFEAPKRMVTEDWEKVTCKLCLKKRDVAQTEMFP